MAVHSLSECLSVTIMHPAKAAGWNKKPFVGDIHAVPLPSNTVLDIGSSTSWEGEIWGSKFALQTVATVTNSGMVTVL